MFNFRFRLNCDIYPHPIYNVSLNLTKSVSQKVQTGFYSLVHLMLGSTAPPAQTSLP